MENVVIKVKSKSDSKFISELAKKLGFDSFVLSDFDKRFLARKNMVEWVQNTDRSNISEKEVKEIVEKVRAKRYAKRKKD